MGMMSDIDPVCGMSVDPAKAAGSQVHEGRTFSFCSQHCLKKFQSDPDAALAKGRPTEEAPSGRAPGNRYTCPMDPEIEMDHPAACPKCGMALEPMTLTLPTRTGKRSTTCSKISARERTLLRRTSGSMRANM